MRKIYSFHNKASDTYINISLICQGVMVPSFSTGLLIEHMEIRKNEKVLDLGAGTGAIGISALLLGAKKVVFVDRLLECNDIIRSNCEANGIKGKNVNVCIGDLFEPINEEFFDHILFNPPSVPSLESDCLPIHHKSGHNGRYFHDIFQNQAHQFLYSSGRLTVVHSSLCDIDLSIATLEEKGYSIKLKGPYSIEFRSYYPVSYLEKLSKNGKCVFFKKGNKIYEERYVLEAKKKSV